jgi:hypothetical protein
MTRLSLDWIDKCLRPSPPLGRGFQTCEFTPEVWTIEQTINATSLWSTGTKTFSAHADEKTGFDLAKATALMGTVTNYPVTLIAFSLTTLTKAWPDAYKTVGDTMVVFDGNHRATAIAMTHAATKTFANAIIVFRGTIR